MLCIYASQNICILDLMLCAIPATGINCSECIDFIIIKLDISLFHEFFGQTVISAPACVSLEARQNQVQRVL